jgi:hypothetical protein
MCAGLPFPANTFSYHAAEDVNLIMSRSDPNGMMEHCTTVRSQPLRPNDFLGNTSKLGRHRERWLRVHRPITVMPFGFRTGLQFRPARLVDCSRHGVGVLLAEPLVPGEQVMIRAKLKDIVLLIYTVRNCHAWEEGYRIGARFSGIIGPPDDRDASVVLDALLESEGA